MNNFEKLIAEFENELTFKFRCDMPDGLPAIIINKTIYINSKIPYDEAITYLSEEIGHYKTLANGIDITDQSILFNRKMELKGREWGYKKLVPREKLLEYINNRETVYTYDIADEFNLPVNYVNEVVMHYQRKGIF
ncbi:ImmA/IrrE family metallo-endopeptidase [Globicatella sp. PHS-GS-PNBC-21-1553]|uniref:ImmA/IrrE family metallo-endopeptidase n=1 Tax=Globicatella sp. PHS-GS-PNBC-21-1553 TaxID=2885764 RepID=UPI00298F31FB|nr:ImmA/IrrE family metallo-endopeptidase [Globicatella sp. PHS-GS-PNBC-21-1553]WPC08787.1 hypothetical protein LB888_00580 [Globicatella sp. PHS-GS-PNBC-21-1553]